MGLGASVDATLQLSAMALRAKEIWGDERTTVHRFYADGDHVVTCYHVEGADDEGRTVFDELTWHSGRMDTGECLRRLTRSSEPGAARNETEQVLLEEPEEVDL
jgi:hypothetical protein